MDEIALDAHREARAWIVGGGMAIAAGLAVWVLNWVNNHGWWVGWLCGSLFVAVGGYVIHKAGALVSDVERLVHREKPCDMQLTILVDEGDMHLGTRAELRFPDSERERRYDIRVFVDYQPWFDKVTGPLPAKVWGADHQSGPVVIETAHGRLLPSGPGAVARLGWSGC